MLSVNKIRLVKMKLQSGRPLRKPDQSVGFHGGHLPDAVGG